MKTLKELTLLSKFLFDQTMDIPEANEATLQIILGDDKLRLLNPAQTEKELRTAPWLRSIRLDVFAMDESRAIYDTEMQAEYRNDLVKRSRYYQSLIDSSLLEPGAVNFNALNNTYIIMITPFDLFGEGKYCYTFRSYCEEDKNILLEDGAVRIFLNTRGTNDDEVSRELIDFLHYVECTDGDFAEKTGNEKIKKIHACVCQIKASEEMGVKYMQTWEEKIIEREKGKAEGIAQGKAEGIAQGKAEGILELLKEYGIIPEQARRRIMEEKDISVLSKWLKIAAKSVSLEQFIEQSDIMNTQSRKDIE